MQQLRSNQSSGFILAEILVTLSILAIVSIALFEIMALSHRAIQTAANGNQTLFYKINEMDDQILRAKGSTSTGPSKRFFNLGWEPNKQVVIYGTGLEKYATESGDGDDSLNKLKAYVPSAFANPWAVFAGVNNGNGVIGLYYKPNIDPDSSDWTIFDLPELYDFTPANLIWCGSSTNQMWVMVGKGADGNGKIYTSTNLRRWNKIEDDLNKNKFKPLNAITWGGNGTNRKFIAVGKNAVYKSADGNKWENITPDSALNYTDVAWGGLSDSIYEGFVVTASFYNTSTTNLYRLTEKTNEWIPITYWSSTGTIKQPFDLVGVSRGKDRFVVAGNVTSSSPKIINIVDNDTKMPKFDNPSGTQPLTDVAWIGDRFFLTRTKGQFATYKPDDSTVWETSVLGSTAGTINTALLVGNRVVIANSNGFIYFSDENSPTSFSDDGRDVSPVIWKSIAKS
ncbi:pilus assembly FimT family protein [Heliophilum fasciatum]|uniref:Uncharacterized protein n=1 Tax=Heliophilum fasciatum TaxID=35700 RepID=A0A4V2SXR1_9FIRM|nr:prepilin-type N-terminal cleavage/methylation domain-containing protein [Heliophilum fasciatum]MCW2277268.1 type II secretory pathway pseudopilin PulG [Heliophilum fasciatum]TCP67106.1 hypothetical protein EDD73_1051 [Heliophilum fasciatum]